MVTSKKTEHTEAFKVYLMSQWKDDGTRKGNKYTEDLV